MKLALDCAVHAQLESAVTDIVPDVAAEETLVVVDPSVTEQAPVVLGEAGVELLLHAARANAAADDAARTIRRRGSLISRSF